MQVRDADTTDEVLLSCVTFESLRMKFINKLL